MIRAEQVPDEVFEAFQKAWAVTSTLSTKECLAAALNAWPGMGTVATEDHAGTWRQIILPLTESGKPFDQKEDQQQMWDIAAEVSRMGESGE